MCSNDVVDPNYLLEYRRRIVFSNVPIRGLYGQQSQAESTYLAPFSARLKKTLRLNRDQSFIRPHDTSTDDPMEKKRVSVTESRITVVKAIGDKSIKT